jgi:MFS transporter, DHA2 family, multidrug resistance protein
MKQAYAAINGMVEQQAGMLAYADVFFILAVMFLACIPLIFLMKKPKKGGGPGMGAH